MNGEIDDVCQLFFVETQSASEFELSLGLSEAPDCDHDEVQIRLAAAAVFFFAVCSKGFSTLVRNSCQPLIPDPRSPIPDP